MSQPLSNGWHGKREGKTNIKKFEYLKNKQSFFDEIKNIVFEGLSFDEKWNFDKK